MSEGSHHGEYQNRRLGRNEVKHQASVFSRNVDARLPVGLIEQMRFLSARRLLCNMDFALSAMVKELPNVCNFKTLAALAGL